MALTMTNRLPMISTVLALTALTGCGSSFAMIHGDGVPGARGEIAASFEREGNSKMKMHVEHLPLPADVSPKSTVYVVWVKAKNGKADAAAQNVGTLAIDPTDLDGELGFTTSFSSFDVTVTPEPTADVTTPSGRDVLKATVTAD